MIIFFTTCTSSQLIVDLNLHSDWCKAVFWLSTVKSAIQTKIIELTWSGNMTMKHIKDKERNWKMINQLSISNLSDGLFVVQFIWLYLPLWRNMQNYRQIPPSPFRIVQHLTKYIGSPWLILSMHPLRESSNMKGCSTGPSNWAGRTKISLLLSSSVSPCICPQPSPLWFQHQRALVAPPGWSPVSHFLLMCTAAIQVGKAPSGLSGPQRASQQGRSPVLPGHLRSRAQNGAPLSHFVIWWPRPKGRQSQVPWDSSSRLADCSEAFSFWKHVYGWF